jgi:Holliday junction resolvase RusA-like endonuclease
MGKPTMTQRDKWKLRPCVVAYRAWCDRIRAAAGVREPYRLERLTTLFVQVYQPMPRQWSARKRKELDGTPHGEKPDGDNLLKAICDALFVNDQRIWSKTIHKRWADDAGARCEIAIL